ncbi:dihydrolipoyl dehydrogenase [Rummeliibacillus sp. SL167]|uniref:dihydrolipoyl dehydrogenase n=1 Tax=Rummeliibacillus sp. SL167 TaxID=2579792 RepID=UPI0011B37A1A|nr:dihydrolipoyl dehydrogenase [Rummeliibacillus sp. SL167]
MAKNYDLVIVGGGPGGYVAAIRAAQLGLSTAIVEQSKLGGTCLHKGCIPSKALLRSAEVYRTTKEQAHTFGVEVQNVTFNFEQAQKRKNDIIDQLHKGIQGLMKKGKIDVFEGYGRILGPSIFSPMSGTISVEFDDDRDNEMLIPKNVIIATGSRPRTLKGLIPDGSRLLSSDDLMTLQQLPKSLLIVGGGVIGIEWASLLHDFGVEVTIVEYSNTILPTEDQDIQKAMTASFKKRGIQIITNAHILPETLQDKQGYIEISAEVDGKQQQFSAEKILLSVGRQANIENIGLENTDIEVNRGFIEVNPHYQTKESHIYAIGDVIGGLQLAHVASHEGIHAVEHIAGLNPETIESHKIARCIYGNPEVASIGLTEKQAREQEIEIAVGKFPFAAIGKALVFGEKEGFVKIIADKKTDDIVGVHIMGAHATELISEASLAMLVDATPWEMSAHIHPHPSLSEAIGEAALAVEGKAIHQ